MASFSVQHIRILALLALISLPALASAGGVHPDYRAGKTATDCDTLFPASGSAIILAKVVSVEPRSITYIPCDNLDGPPYTIPRTQVRSIRYAGGQDPRAAADRPMRPTSAPEGMECDNIFPADGTSPIFAKVVSVELRSITYIPCDNLQGPSYTIPRTQVRKIQYVGGKEELFTAAPPAQQAEGMAQPNPMAVLSFLLGLVGLFIGLFLSIGVGLLMVVPGLILGFAALSRISKFGGAGKGLAIAGIILNAAAILISGFALLILIALFA